MRFLKPDAEIWEQKFPDSSSKNFQEECIQYMYEHIEKCGRVCYKSSDKIGDKPAKEFINRLINSGHGAMLEHGTVYLNIPCKLDYNDYGDITWIKIKSNSSYEEYEANPYTRVNLVKHGWATEGNIYITTNYRVLVENGWLDDLKYVCAPTEYHEKRYTICFTTDIGVSREANRHRVDSIAEESTRYCNYNKDKFGKELNYIVPAWFDLKDINEAVSKLNPFMSSEYTEKENQGIAAFYTGDWSALDWWLWGLKCCEVAYMKQIELGLTPQQARQSLPLNTKTTLVHTAFESDWKHFFDLRVLGTTGAPHPNMKKVAEIAYNKVQHG